MFSLCMKDPLLASSNPGVQGGQYLGGQSNSLWDSSEAQVQTPKEKGAGLHRQVVVLGARGVGQLFARTQEHQLCFCAHFNAM